MPPKERFRLSSSKTSAKNKVVAEIAKQKADLIGDLHVAPRVIPLLPCVIEPLLPWVNLNSVLSSSENYQSPTRQTSSMKTALITFLVIP